ncbi:hypothetical protein E2C01_086507 [Portunus trituberculatus]|uniref:Uncharacterized protein n=1 Tax=Portunus trituberculatus TaxID=210409 RepID=A0A5B7JDN3_PORTR|nr:hypothetical protein [Portunus trituberculatus]
MPCRPSPSEANLRNPSPSQAGHVKCLMAWFVVLAHGYRPLPLKAVMGVSEPFTTSVCRLSTCGARSHPNSGLVLVTAKYEDVSLYTC